MFAVGRSRSVSSVAFRRWRSTTTSSDAQLTHINATSNLPQMVNVVDKSNTKRVAKAACRIRLPQNIKDYLQKHQSETGKADIQTKKGPVVATAIIAATMAAKKTSDLIPFCHPIPLYGCDVKIEPSAVGFDVEAQVWTEHRTGVEMEALTAVSVAALTVYDMCKAMSHDIVIEDIHLVSKEGGKHGNITTRPSVESK
eukprot:TRINITY_DN6782_c0_g1_i1.p1 TRINITY_DN6782_c0_g1~~TRINITY_DN6782_c0_g1_i1.p1  ORF type:complete len:198 (-),score=29.83 TRINITY_DN6782_c0_g1_i1:155-748(-)